MARVDTGKRKGGLQVNQGQVVAAVEHPPVQVPAEWQERLERRALAPLVGTSWRYWIWLAFLLAIVGWALYAYSRQLAYGLIVAGVRDRISWGLYIISFVFFIGISHAGTLLSAILRATKKLSQKP
jgi:hypothetical protein